MRTSFLVFLIFFSITVISFEGLAVPAPQEGDETSTEMMLLHHFIQQFITINY
jgi:hypothetical protein